MWGPVTCGGKPYFPEKNWRPFLVITVRVSAVSSPDHRCRFYAFIHFALVHSGIAHYFRHAKNLPLLLWGPLFVGVPVRPNMLNMPKSAAALGDF